MAWMSLLLLLAASESSACDCTFRTLSALQTQSALEMLEACLSKQPTPSSCHYARGWRHWLDGELEQAATAWAAALQLDPSLPGVAFHLAEARAQQDARAAVPSPQPPPAGLRLRATGDVMLGTDFPEGHLPPDDGAHLLDAVRPELRDADLTFVNLEGPLCDGGVTKKCKRSRNCYAFRTPTRYVKYLVDAGVDLASTANNHSGDFGESCRRETEAALDQAGIAWSGPPGTVARLQHRGLRVAMVAFHTSPACNHLNDLPGAAELVRRTSAEADLVIVSFHGGAEGKKALHVPHGPERFFRENRGDLRRFARVVIDAGADVVLGHGPHVARGMELYQGRLVAYSMGNFATYGRFDLSGHLGWGMILEVELGPDGRFLRGRIIPTVQVGEGVPQIDEKGQVIGLVQKLTAEDFPEAGLDILNDGSLRPTPKPHAVLAD